MNERLAIRIGFLKILRRNQNREMDKKKLVSYLNNFNVKITDLRFQENVLSATIRNCISTVFDKNQVIIVLGPE